MRRAGSSGAGPRQPFAHQCDPAGTADGQQRSRNRPRPCDPRRRVRKPRREPRRDKGPRRRVAVTITGRGRMRLPFFYGWLLVGIAFVTMAVGVNARTAFSLLFPPILDEFGWDRGVTAGIFSFGFLVSAMVTPCVGRLMDRRGPMLVVELGVVAMAAGLLLAAWAHETWQLYLTLGGLVGSG